MTIWTRIYNWWYSAPFFRRWNYAPFRGLPRQWRRRVGNTWEYKDMAPEEIHLVDFDAVD